MGAGRLAVQLLKLSRGNGIHARDGEDGLLRELQNLRQEMLALPTPSRKSRSAGSLSGSRAHVFPEQGSNSFGGSGNSPARNADRALVLFVLLAFVKLLGEIIFHTHLTERV